MPIFKYLSQRPLTSNFLRNFQLVGFVDAGTAWNYDDQSLESVVTALLGVGHELMLAVAGQAFAMSADQAIKWTDE